MRKYELTVNDQSFSIAVRSFSTEHAELEIDGTIYQVEINDIITEGEPGLQPPQGHIMRALDRPAATPSPPPAANAGDGSRTGSALVSPIPGQVLEIFVKEGSSVSAGEPVLKMEAMKMENVISAHADGVVGKIFVRPGDAVNQGQELLEIG